MKFKKRYKSISWFPWSPNFDRKLDVFHTCELDCPDNHVVYQNWKVQISKCI